MAQAAMLAAPAMAADMRVKAKPPPVVAADPDWSGIYGGASLGGVWSEPHRFMPNLPQVGVPPTTFVSHGSDTIYDFHAGIQWQWHQWILGAEAGYSSGFNGIASSVSVSPPEPFTHLSATAHVTQLFTVGPRLGVAWGRFMAYGTGGYAQARINGSYSCSDTGLPAFPGPVGNCTALFGAFLSQQDFGGVTWNDGWFAGGGLEFMAYRGSVADIIAGAEYQHFSVGLKTAFVCTVLLCGGFTTHQNFLQDARGDILRARLTIKTDGLGPFALKK